MGFPECRLVIHDHHRSVAPIQIAFQNFDFLLDRMIKHIDPRCEFWWRIRLEMFEFRNARFELTHSAITKG